MAFQVMDIGVSVPASGSGSISRAIPTTGIVLAAFGLKVGAGTNRVFVRGTVGFSSTLGTPTVSFKVLRDNAVVFSTVVSTVAVNESRTVSFESAEENVPAGYHSYKLTAEVTNGLLNQASAVGPVTFSGIGYATP